MSAKQNKNACSREESKGNCGWWWVLDLAGFLGIFVLAREVRWGTVKIGWPVVGELLFSVVDSMGADDDLDCLFLLLSSSTPELSDVMEALFPLRRRVFTFLNRLRTLPPFSLPSPFSDSVSFSSVFTLNAFFKILFNYIHYYSMKYNIRYNIR